MGRLSRSAAGLLLLWSAPVGAQALVERWSHHIREASARFDIPARWIRKVMSAESGGRTRLGDRPIESSAGAMGLMQLMPGTWREMRQAHGLGADPHDPRDNILAGAAYLRRMYDRFGYPGLFAAYNAGPARYAAHLGDGRALPLETRAYVARIAGADGRAALARTAASAPPVAGLFAILKQPRGRQEPAAALPSPEDGLFVPVASAGAGE